MIFTVAGERFQRRSATSSSAPPRGSRSSSAAPCPVMVNGFFVAAFSLVVGGLIVGIDIPAGPLRASPARDGDLHLLRARASG